MARRDDLPHVNQRAAMHLPELPGVELFDQFLDRDADQQFGIRREHRRVFVGRLKIANLIH